LEYKRRRGKVAKPLNTKGTKATKEKKKTRGKRVFERAKGKDIFAGFAVILSRVGRN
jgi:hypothetical protein